MKILKLIALSLLTITLLSCNDWLDNPPFDKIEGNKLYQTESGAQTALNGLYMRLMSRDLYGGNLTFSMLDAMAQFYYTPNDKHNYYEISKLNYNNPGVKGRFSAVWSTAYKLIAECNVFLEQIEKNKGRYKEENYNFYRGEAIALRTYLHFDLFRLFGPEKSKDMTEMDKTFIPYYNYLTESPSPLYSGNQFMKLLEEDIDSAIVLLQNDPILIGLDKGDSFWSYRPFRMNLFAAYALKARMYLHIGNNDGAYMIASSLLTSRDPQTGEDNNFMKTITFYNDLPIWRRERMFFSELLFGMHDIRRDEIQRDFFSQDLEDKKLLIARTSILNELYEAGDIRKGQWSEVSRGTEVALSGFYKYSVQNLAEKDMDPYRYQFIPLIRASELLLIAAEASDNDTDKRKWLEILRYNRGFATENTKDLDLDEVLMKEYHREFYGEGQYFYYLKRNNVGSVIFQGTGTEIAMKYQLPIPDVENDNR